MHDAKELAPQSIVAISPRAARQGSTSELPPIRIARNTPCPPTRNGTTDIRANHRAREAENGRERLSKELIIDRRGRCGPGYKEVRALLIGREPRLTPRIVSGQGIDRYVQPIALHLLYVQRDRALQTLLLRAPARIGARCKDRLNLLLLLFAALRRNQWDTITVGTLLPP